LVTRIPFERRCSADRLFEPSRLWLQTHRGSGQSLDPEVAPGESLTDQSGNTERNGGRNLDGLQDHAVGQRIGGADAESRMQNADHGELEDADIGGRRRHNRGDVDGEEHRSGSTNPSLAAEPECRQERPARQELDRPSAELSDRGEGALARPAEDSEPDPDLNERRVDCRSNSGHAAVTIAAHQRRRNEDDQQQGERHEAEDEELLRTGVEEVGGRDDDYAEQRQRHDVEQRLRYERAEQDRECLTHAPHPSPQ